MTVNMLPIKVGTYVRCALPFTGEGIVYRIHHQDGTKSRSREPQCAMWFADVVFAERIVRRVSFAVLRSSSKWSVCSEVAAPEAIDSMLEHTRKVLAARRAAEQSDAQRFETERAALRADSGLAGLTQGFDIYSGTLAAKNIRVQLMEHFPGVAFDIRKGGYGRLTVIWTDGPCEREVRPIVARYESTRFCPTDALHRHGLSPWVALFGGAESVTVRRSSKPARRSIETKKKDQAGYGRAKRARQLLAHEAGLIEHWSSSYGQYEASPGLE